MAAATEDWSEAAEFGPGALLVLIAASGYVFGTESAEEVEVGAVREAED